MNGSQVIFYLNLPARRRPVFRLLENPDDLLGVRCPNDQSLDNVQAFAGLAQIKLRTARLDIHLVFVPVVEQF